MVFILSIVVYILIRLGKIKINVKKNILKIINIIMIFLLVFWLILSTVYLKE